MSVDAVQSACRAYMTTLHALKLEINRELDRAQEAKVDAEPNDMDRPWERVMRAQDAVIEAIAEHST